MFNRPCLELADVKRMAAPGAEASPLGRSPCDRRRGRPPAWLHAGRRAPISAQIAPAKAQTAALGQRESRIYEEMINNGRVSFLSAPGLQGLLEGGVPIASRRLCRGDRRVPVKSAEDAQIARAGIAALTAA
jgi:uncharacterized protein GlcG (DUF336 family)